MTGLVTGGPPPPEPTVGVPLLKGEPGDTGESAYELAVRQGFVGTLAEWVASIKGAKGDKGDTGADSTVPGPKGDPGADSTVPGPKGDPGPSNLVVSDVNPGLTQPGMWIQTFPNGDMTIWIEDGKP